MALTRIRQVGIVLCLFGRSSCVENIPECTGLQTPNNFQKVDCENSNDDNE